MMLPIVANTAFEQLAVIDDYISFIWTTRYYTCGDFELCVDVNADYVQMLKPNYYVLRDDDENVGIIESIQIQRDEDGHEMMVVSGRFLASILGRRIVGKQTTVTGTVSSCINSLISQNIIDPFIAPRKIDNFVLGSYSFSAPMSAQYTGKNLLETISDICNAYGLGFKVTLNSNDQFVFTLYSGENRTYDQDDNPWVIFSDEYDNLLSSEYAENYREVVNAVMVGGEGEGASRIRQWVTAADDNMLSNDPSAWEQGAMVQGANTSSTTRIRTKTGVSIKPNTTYFFTKTPSCAIAFHQMTKKDGTFIAASDWMTGDVVSFTSAADAHYVRIMIRYDPAATIQPTVMGDGIFAIMQDTSSGLNRREAFKDQRQIRSDDGELSELEYRNLLLEAGQEGLTKYTAAFTGTVYFDNIKYKQDVNIGDLCVIQNSRWGLYINSRLVEVIESVSESGEYSIVPTFGI